MNIGKQFSVDVEGTVYTIVYSKHFAERYDLDEPGRPAVRRSVGEDLIEQKIREALPEIDEVCSYRLPVSGIIQSRSAKLNMSFSVIETSRGRIITMMNAMRKTGYTPKSAKDYIIQVNPPVTVRFRRGISKGLQETVLSDLIPQLGGLEDGTAYHLRGEEVEYWVEMAGENAYVDDADWIRDVYEIQVS
jgi:hypothetical protein